MRIIFIRHGHPNYENDCLTELGRLQASAVAERLMHENIQQIFSSTCGRALETAEYTAKKLGIAEIVPCDFMRELRWGSVEGVKLYSNGQPWDNAGNMIASGQSLVDCEWMTKAPFHENIVTNSVQNVAKCFDELLARLGYRREGDYYRVEANSERTIAIFSHGGSSSAVVGHMFNLPFPFMCGAMPPACTAVHIVRLSGKDGDLVSPKIEIYNDARHIAGISEVANCFG